MAGTGDRAEMLTSWWPGREGKLSPSKTLLSDLFHGSSFHLLIAPSI